MSWRYAVGYPAEVYAENKRREIGGKNGTWIKEYYAHCERLEEILEERQIRVIDEESGKFWEQTIKMAGIVEKIPTRLFNERLGYLKSFYDGLHWEYERKIIAESLNLSDDEIDKLREHIEQIFGDEYASIISELRRYGSHYFKS